MAVLGAMSVVAAVIMIAMAWSGLTDKNAEDTWLTLFLVMFLGTGGVLLVDAGLKWLGWI